MIGICSSSFLCARQRNEAKKTRAPIPSSKPPPVAHTYPLEFVKGMNESLLLLAEGMQKKDYEEDVS